MAKDTDDLFSNNEVHDIDDLFTKTEIDEVDDLFFNIKTDNIEHFIPLYQQGKSFYKSHLSALAYGLEELNSEAVDASQFSSPYEYITALSEQSLKEEKIDIKEQQNIQSFSEKINMIEEGGIIPLSFYKKGLADVYNDIIAPQLKDSDKLEPMAERLTLDQAIGEIPYPLVGDKEREEMFADIIHLHDIPTTAIDKKGVLFEGKHFDEIGSSELSVPKMVIYEYMEGMWNREKSEIADSLELSVNTKKLTEIGITQELIDNMDMSRHSNALVGNNAFKDVVSIVSSEASKPYDEALASMVSYTLKLDKNILVNSVKEVEKTSVNENEEASIDATRVQVNLSYKGRGYEVERIIASTDDKEKYIFMNDDNAIEENKELIHHIKEQYGQVAFSSTDDVEKRIVNMLYDHRINESILDKNEENKPKKKLSSNLSM
jgi:hypothetical protein